MSDRKITFSKEERVHESYLNKRKSEISKSLLNAEMLSYISDEACADIERIKLKFSQIDDKLSNFETLKKYVEIQNDLFIFNEKYDTEKFWHAEKIINLDDKKIYVLIASENENYWLADEFFNVISKITFEEYDEKRNLCNLADYYCKTRRFDLYEKFEVEFELLRVEKYKATNYDFIVNIGHNVLVACLNGKFLIIDEKGQKISKTKYDYISSFNSLGIAYVSVNGKMGLINDKKIIICKPIFTNISEFVFDVAIVHIKGKFGLIDKNGKIICKLKYDDISSFNSAGVAFTRLNRKMGLINTSGKELVPNIFDLITHFNDKNIAKVISNQKIGFINIEGTILIEPKYDEVYEFNTKGVAIYRIGKKYGFVNNSGVELCGAIFDKIHNFNSEGIAIAEINHVYGIVNDEGIALTDIEYGYIDPFQFGYARVSNLQNKWGIINSKGETIIKCECIDIRKITNNVYFICTYDEYKFWNIHYNKFLGPYYIPYPSYERAIDNINGDGTIICNYILPDEKVPKKIFITSDFEEIKIDATTEIIKFDILGIYKIESIGKYGLINKNGEIILKAEYDYIGSFGEGRIATILLNEKYGFINRDLQIVVEPTYDLIIGYEDYILFGLNRKCGLLDYKGNILLEPLYDDIGIAKSTKKNSIYNEKYLSIFNSYGVAIIKNDEKYGLLDKSFEEICPCKYDVIESFNKDGYAKIQKRSRFISSYYNSAYHVQYGLIDYKGNEILKTEYDSIEPLENTNLFIISQLTMYGLANHEGNIILSWFDSISKPDKYGLIRVCKKELYGLANSEGKLLIEPTYNRIEEFDNEGFAKVFKFGLYGIIDTGGNLILSTRYDSIDKPNKFGVIKYSISGRYGIMTRDYTNLTEYLFDEIGDFNDAGIAIVRKRGLYGIINVSGEVLIECKYDNIEFTTYHYIVSLKLNHKYTLYDLKHNRKSRNEYDMIWSNTLGGLFNCEKDGKTYNLNVGDDSIWE